jgi:hypothetical protein
MNKLQIYGDSYANSFIEHGGWMNYSISENYDIENYGASGSPFWYSYQAFLKNKKDTEKVFIMTTDSRYTLNVGLPEKESFWQVAFGPNRDYRWNDKNKITKGNNIFKDYIEYMWDPELEKFNRRLQLKNILDISEQERMIVLDIENIIPISMEEERVYVDSKQQYDKRACHLLPHNNKILGDIILSRLHNKKYGLLTLSIADFDFSKEISDIEKSNFFGV